MLKRRPVRLFLATIALLLMPLLVVATTTGSVWHHHADSNEASCPICHLSHQPIAPTLAVDHAPDLAPLGKQLDVPEPAEAPTPSILRIPARAPPAA
ncbi:MAG: hypothetical protein KGL02_01910 [Acidobacteriota bacterium]|nr:hypothetical protein [Acidobacteriota bacterium]MDE3170701.1 hypothetical protein [Acidobacteriota bacterium]